MVGSVDSGIKAAAWSPDEELLVLMTGKRKQYQQSLPDANAFIYAGEDKLVEMTKTFDVLSEYPLKTDDPGQGKDARRAHIDV